MNTLTGPAHQYLTGRWRRGEISRATRDSYRYQVGGFVASYGQRPMSKLGPAAVDRWLESIAHLAPASRRQHVSAVRSFCRWLVKTGRVRTDPTVEVAPVRQPTQVVRTLDEAEVRRLLMAAPDERARLIVMLMVSCGLRCAEVAGLTVGDYDERAGTLCVRGKGANERVVPVPKDAADALADYLAVERVVAGPLVRNRVRAGGVAAKTVSALMRRWMYQAGVKERAYDGKSAHALRRTAGSDVMERSRDVRAVQSMLGHARLETTAKHYLRAVALEQLREAMEGRNYAA